MEFEKKIEVVYKNGNKINHNFSVLSAVQRNKIFGEYLDMKKITNLSNTKDSNPLDAIKENKSVFDFMADVLKASCSSLELDNLIPSEFDKLFADLNEFILTGGSKN